MTKISSTKHKKKNCRTLIAKNKACFPPEVKKKCLQATKTLAPPPPPPQISNEASLIYIHSTLPVHHYSVYRPIRYKLCAILYNSSLISAEGSYATPNLQVGETD